MRIDEITTDEAIDLDGGKANIDFGTGKDGSVSTKFGKLKNKGKDKSKYFVPYQNKVPFRDEHISSLFGAKSQAAASNTLKALKRKNVDPDQYAKLMDRAAIFATRLIKKDKIDIIVMPESSSPLTQDFVEALVARNPHIDVVPNAASKNLKSHEIMIFDPNGQIGYKEVGMIRKAINDSFQQFGKLDMKNIKPGYRRYIKNHMIFNNNVDPLDKNVLVVDDIFTSGSTIKDMMDQLVEMGAASIHGLTMFKMTK